MDEFARWLEEQIAEDERIARATHPKFLTWEYDECVRQIRDLGNGNELANVLPRPAYGEHMAKHDPARVLREVDAKRQLLALHEPSRNVGRDSDPDDPATFVDCCGWCQTTVVQDGDWPCETLRLLVLPYSDRPGYRDEWRP